MDYWIKTNLKLKIINFSNTSKVAVIFTVYPFNKSIWRFRVTELKLIT